MRSVPVIVRWVAVIASLVLAGCGASPSRSPVMVSVPGAELVSPACREAVRFAAAIPDSQDRPSDLDDAIRVCQTPEEWVTATAMFPAALHGADADAFLGARCALPGLGRMPLCQARDASAQAVP